MFSGWKYINAKDDAAAAKGKNGIQYGLTALALVFSSYAIIRLVQYIAQG
jgi:hypothetical protein